MSATVSFKVPTPRGPESVTVSYARVGHGEPLVLLHGIGHHRQAWDPVVDILATERDVIAVDLPGFGASPALPDGLAYDLPTTNTVLGGLFEALELDRPHAAGNSLGGLLALSWAGRSSYGPSRPCPPPGSGRRPNAGTPSRCCSRCAASPSGSRCRWWNGCRARRPAAPR